MGQGDPIQSASHVVILPSALKRPDWSKRLNSVLKNSTKKPVILIPRGMFSPLVSIGIHPDPQETILRALSSAIDISGFQILVAQKPAQSSWGDLRWSLEKVEKEKNSPTNIWILHGRIDPMNLRVALDALLSSTTNHTVSIEPAPPVDTPSQKTFRQKIQHTFSLWMSFAHMTIFGETHSLADWPEARAYVRSLRAPISKVPAVEK